MIEIGKCSDEKLKTMLDEAREASKHSLRLGKVMGIVSAHRLKNMREFLAYQELATWRRMNGFDRVEEGEESCFNGHRSLPPRPQEYYAGLWSEVNALKAAVPMPAEDTVNRPRQKDSLDELLANFGFARIKEYVEKRDREAVQVQVTVAQVNTVQHSSPYPLDSKPSPDVCVNLENNEGRMDPELDELKTSSAGTGLKTPGQQCPPNEGIWETRRTTDSGILTAGAGPSQRENISSPTEREKGTTTVADISSKAATPPKRRHKTFSKQNKQFDPGGRREEAPPSNTAVALLSFPCGELGGFLFVLCASCFVSALCPPVFSKLLIYPGDTSQQAEIYEGDTDRVAEVRNRRASIFLSITLLKMARTSNVRFGRSANALG